MIYSEFTNIKIAGISTAVPDNFIQTDNYKELFGEKVIDDFMQVTGIKQTCRASPDQTASDFACLAARDVIERSGINRDDIGFLIFVTQKPDYRMPSTAFYLHSRLNLNSDCSCFDINLACSGFVYGLQTIISMLQYSDKPYALLLTGDTTVKSISPKDKTMIMLFGDAGTATLLQKTMAEQEKISFALRTDGKRFNAIVTPAGAYRNMGAPREDRIWNDGIERSDYDTHMKGMEVFAFSITDVPKLIKEFVDFQGKDISSYDQVILHQANRYIIKQIARKLKIPMEKIPISIDKYGNTSSNSIPLVLCDHFSNKQGQIMKILASGFGAGLSWAVCDLSLSTDIINHICFLKGGTV
ncbi:3-oxoacyl-ACP synthase [Spirochaetia bacterium]|nr:3-oxoacyl-ACP synthase [Spirochaetia bacterium]